MPSKKKTSYGINKRNISTVYGPKKNSKVKSGSTNRTGFNSKPSGPGGDPRKKKVKRRQSK